MRELKFRAFNKKEKKICKVVSTDFKHLVTIRFPEFDGLIGDFDDQMELIEFEPLMQYTGLKDKNGVEIYEGDIVTDGMQTFAVDIGEQVIEGDFGEEIIYYGCNILLGGGYPTAVKNEYEVIGNIHEHPELLEESK